MLIPGGPKKKERGKGNSKGFSPPKPHPNRFWAQHAIPHPFPFPPPPPKKKPDGQRSGKFGKKLYFFWGNRMSFDSPSMT